MMISIRNTASEIARYVAAELHYDENNRETIRYGLEIILGALLKGIVVLSISYWLGITPYVLAALVTSSALRLLSGGVHCSTYGRCLVFGSALAILTGTIAYLTGPYMNKQSLLLFTTLSALTGMYIVSKWAPVDSASKPITNKQKRQKYKKISFLYIIVWATVITSFSLLSSGSPSAFSLALASVGGFLAQIFSLSPAGYRLVHNIDHLLSKILT